MAEKLSKEAQSALLAGSAQGVPLRVPSEKLWRELTEAGLIGRNDGLTRKGAIERQKLLSKRLDGAFGK